MVTFADFANQSPGLAVRLRSAAGWLKMNLYHIGTIFKVEAGIQ
jgi:hypothetical protein